MPTKRYADVWGPIATALLAALGLFPLIGCRGALCVLRTEWISGSAIVLGLGVTLAICSRHFPALWPARPARAIGGAMVRAGPWRVAGALALAAFVLYAAVSAWVFERRPILIDEIALVRQAQIFASGHLWLPAPRHPEFFSVLQMVDARGRVYSQYPPGGPAMLTPFVLVGATWLAGPFFGALAVAAFAAFARAAEPDARIATAAVAVFAFAPFVALMSGTHMSCVPALAWILAGAAATAQVARADGPRPGLAFGAGLAFGVAATIRPVDALAFALPAAVWYLRLHWRNAGAAAIGVALPVGAMLYVNARTTGAPLLFGYEVLWGAAHDLGFHETPVGGVHTPAEGLRFISTYVVQLDQYLFETPIPSLAPAMIALASARSLRAPDRYLLASAALLAALYAAYWHPGFFLGPRFFFALTPLAALWTARSVRVFPRSAFLQRTATFALATSLGVALVVGAPARVAQWSSSFATERWAQPDVARAAGVHDALVFVREGWEGQLAARLGAAGVSAPAVERLMRTVDACRLDSAVTALETRRAVDLGALERDSALVRAIQLGTGARVRAQVGYPYSAHCAGLAVETARGVTPLAPLSILDDGNVYARDLGARDTALIAAFAGRQIWLVHPSSAAPDARPAFYRGGLDSVTRLIVARE